MIINSIVDKQAINKGWSGDKKYSITTLDGSRYFLRVSPLNKAEHRRREFDKMCEIEVLGIPMAKPIEFGVCDDGVYTVESFVDGIDAEEYIQKLSSDNQYAYGIDAGKILKKLHSISAPQNIPTWEIRFNDKINRKVEMYQNCELKYEKDIPFINYIRENRHLLSGRPQTYQHGDYHIGNMMVDRNGFLTIIDFDRDDFGDPWEEFNRIVWCAQTASHFARGMVDGYFDNVVPLEFWKLLALYICTNTLSSLPWAVPFGDKEISVMKKQANDILYWYDDMQNVIPSWYRDE